MRQAIQVTYYGPTNTKGARWRAKAQAGTIWFCRDYAMDHGDDAKFCAQLFAENWGWLKDNTSIEGGCLHDGSYCFVLTNK